MGGSVAAAARAVRAARAAAAAAARRAAGGRAGCASVAAGTVRAGQHAEGRGAGMGGGGGGGSDGGSGSLPGVVDRFNGVTVDLRGEAPGAPAGEGVDASFEDRLRRAQAEWEREGRTGAWLVLPPALAGACTGPALAAGFQLHHATPDKLVLNKWLSGPPDTSRLPKYSHSLLGVGAVVLNKRGELLVVQEKHGVLKGQGVWKMPTGLVEPGEDLQAAAVREVLEETGLRCRFDGLLTLRQMHGFAFGQSDLFFICALSPEDCATPLRCQEEELEGCQWMPLPEYLSQPWWTETHDATSVYGVVNRLISSFARGAASAAPLQSLASRRGSDRRASLFSFTSALD